MTALPLFAIDQNNKIWHTFSRWLSNSQCISVDRLCQGANLLSLRLPAKPMLEKFALDIHKYIYIIVVCRTPKPRRSNAIDRVHQV